ncbi:MAG: glutamate--tRNA ligase [Thermoplasmataceae archaeon]
MSLDDEIRKQIIRNAFQHDGKADPKSIIGKIMGMFPEARSDVAGLTAKIKDQVEAVNSISKDSLNEIVSREFPEFLVREKKVQEHRLVDLENVNGTVVMRMAPSASGPLHIGHSRMAILNDEYVKRYGGKLILRIEDTNPNNIDPFAYTQIPKDLEWLGVNVTDTLIQSDRFEIYYEEARKLILGGHAYVCHCKQNDFKQLKLSGSACQHRSNTVANNLAEFEGMIRGDYEPGTATLVIKTDLKHPNPSIRDWIAFRVVDGDHARFGKQYHAYPMMNFSVAIDDHLLGLTHVIRGKDHLNNTEKQKYIYIYNNWKIPVYYHYGLITIPNTILKTSTIKKGIKNGEFSGWDDIRLGTLLTMKKRGYSPAAIRRYWIESGLREIDADFSWEIFNAMNKDIIDPIAKRFWFVKDPVEIKVHSHKPLESRAPYHPGHTEMGYRSYSLGTEFTIFVQRIDWETVKDGDDVRLKDLCAVTKHGSKSESHDRPVSKENPLKIIHWCPSDSERFNVLLPNGDVDKGLLEPLALDYEGISQFERYGYVNKVGDEGFFLYK